MRAEIIDWIGSAWEVLRSNSRWMAWNLFLAFVPLALSVWLFRTKQRRESSATSSTQSAGPLSDKSRSPLWWLGLFIFITFLPNAPYVLTDVIHLVQDIRADHSIWVITLIVIPQYCLFIFAGLEAYVVSLINLGYYLRRQGWGKFILGAELLIHGLSAIGIYLGRFLRFNSWDLVTQLDTLAGSVVDDVVGKRPLVVIIVTFMVIAGLYGLMKQVTLALASYRRSTRTDPSAVRD